MDHQIIEITHRSSVSRDASSFKVRRQRHQISGHAPAAGCSDTPGALKALVSTAPEYASDVLLNTPIPNPSMFDMAFGEIGRAHV